MGRAYPLFRSGEKTDLRIRKILSGSQRKNATAKGLSPRGSSAGNRRERNFPMARFQGKHTESVFGGKISQSFAKTHRTLARRKENPVFAKRHACRICAQSFHGGDKSRCPPVREECADILMILKDAVRFVGGTTLPGVEGQVLPRAETKKKSAFSPSRNSKRSKTFCFRIPTGRKSVCSSVCMPDFGSGRSALCVGKISICGKGRFP